MQTSVLSNYELAQVVEFPVRICDLTQNTHITITLYDLNKPFNLGPLGSSVIDIFNSKGVLRQGTFNLYIWQGKNPDMSFKQLTPGLFEELPSEI